MRWPTADPYVSSPFGQRKHPVTGEVTLHAGADFPKPVGGALYAIREMRIAGKGRSTTGGNWVSGDMPDGQRAIYYHMAAQSPLVVGRTYPEGTVVGEMGETGLYTKGIHVHFEVRRNNVPIDPVAYIKGGMTSGGGGNVDPIDPETGDDMTLTPEQDKRLKNIEGYLYAGGPDVDAGRGETKTIFGRLINLDRQVTSADKTYVDTSTNARLIRLEKKVDAIIEALEKK